MKRGRFARLWQWVERQANGPRAQQALFAVAFAEASVFPVPPDAMLAPLVMAQPQRVWRWALVCTLGSALGAVAGWWIGFALFESVARPLLALYGIEEAFAKAQQGFAEHGAWLVLLAAVSPLPFKAITIAAGAFAMPWLELFVLSFFARGLRFFLLAALIAYGGTKLRRSLHRNAPFWLGAAMAAMVAGFALLWALR